jgi:hypothetical protein
MQFFQVSTTLVPYFGLIKRLPLSTYISDPNMDPDSTKSCGPGSVPLEASSDAR